MMYMKIEEILEKYFIVGISNYPPQVVLPSCVSMFSVNLQDPIESW